MSTWGGQRLNEIYFYILKLDHLIMTRCLLWLSQLDNILRGGVIVNILKRTKHNSISAFAERVEKAQSSELIGM